MKMRQVMRFVMALLMFFALAATAKADVAPEDDDHDSGCSVVASRPTSGAALVALLGLPMLGLARRRR